MQMMNLVQGLCLFLRVPTVFIVLWLCLLLDVKPTTTAGECLRINLLTVLDTGNGVKVTHKHATFGTSQTLYQECLPSVCGRGFARCNALNITDDSSLRSIVAVPVVRGVLLISYSLEMVNGTVLQLLANHTLEVPQELIGQCQVAFLIDLTGTNQQRSIFSSSPSPHVAGLCLNETGSENIQTVSITMDFGDISRSSISRDTNVRPVILNYFETLPNFIFTSSLPQCWSGLIGSQTFYFHRSAINVFDVTSEEADVNSYLLYRGPVQGELFTCNPLQLVHIPRQMLILYCENSSAEIDSCMFSGNSVSEVRYHDAADGIPYYCSGDINTLVSLRGRTVIFNSSLHEPVDLNDTVVFGDCIKRDNETVFVFTSKNGDVYLVDPQREPPVSLLGRTLGRHYVYDDIILFNNGLSSVLYNTSCKDDPIVTTVDHPYHLSLQTFDGGTRSCSCRSSRDNPDFITTQLTTSTSTHSPTKNSLSIGTIIGIIVAVVLPPIVIVVVTVAILCLFKLRKKNTKSDDNNIM